MILGFFMGSLADKYKIYKLMQITSYIVIGSGAIMMYDILKDDGHSVTFLFYAGYLIS